MRFVARWMIWFFQGSSGIGPPKLLVRGMLDRTDVHHVQLHVCLFGGSLESSDTFKRIATDEG